MPATVYDRGTGQPVTGEPEDLAAGIASGKYAFEKGTTVPLKGEKGVEQVPSAQAVEKISSGDYSLPSAEDEAQDQVAKEEEAKGPLKSIAEGTESGLNQLFLGVPEAVAEHVGTPEERAHREAVEQYHSVARTLGGTLGFGASMLLGGEAFKGLEMAGKAAAGLVMPAEEAASAALGTKLAAKAVELGTQGAALAAPQALVHAAFGDPKQAAETLAWGAGLGSVLGVPGELLGAAGGAIGKAARGLNEEGSRLNDFLEKQADTLTPRAMGAQKSQVLKIPQERREAIIKFAHENGLIKPGMTKDDIGAAVRALYEEKSNGVGDTIRSLDATRDMASADALPGVLDAHLTPGKIGDAIEGAFDQQELSMNMNRDQKAAVDALVEDARNLPTVDINGRQVVTFETAQKFKQSLYQRWAKSTSKVANEGGLKGQQMITPLDQAKADAYAVVRNVLGESSRDVALASGQPELAGKLIQHNRDLSMLHTLRDWTGNAEAQSLGNKGFGLTDWLAGHAGATVGGLAGGPVGAALGFGASYLVKHWAENKGLIYLSSAARRAAASGDANVFAAVLGADAQQRLSQTMQGVQDTVKRMALEGIQATATRKNEHLKALLGDTNGLSSAKQLEKLQSRVTELASSPAALASATAAVVGPLSLAAPQVADATQAQLGRAVQYLSASIPRAPGPPAPFAPQTWTPSAAQTLAYHDKAEVVANPMSAMQHVSQGTLSDAHVDALKRVYPVIYDQMKKEVLAFAAEHPGVHLPTPERASLAKFLGVSLNALDTPESVSALQATYAGTPSDGTAPQNPKMSASKLKDAPSHATTYGQTQGPSQPE